MNKLLGVILLICFFKSYVSAQFSYTGTLVEAGTMLPVANADIFHEESQKIKRSDEQGRFTFEGLSLGTQHFIYFSYSHNTITDTITITADLTKTITLTNISGELNELLIEAKRKELYNLISLKEVEGTAIYAGKKTEVVLVDQLVINKASNNARQLYAEVVGLNIYENSDAGIQLNIGGRGLDPNRSANFSTRQNDYDISADVLGYPESYYSPPAEAISRIEIIRGASSLQYGSQFGGLVNFQLKKPNPIKKIDITLRQAKASFAFNSSYIQIDGSHKKWSYLSYYNRKSQQGYRENSSLRSDNVYAYIAYHSSDNSSISAEYTHLNYLAQQAGGLTDQDFLDNPRRSNRERNWFKVDWNLFNLKYLWSKEDNYALSINAFGLMASRSAVGFRGNPVLVNLNPITQVDEQDANGNYIYPRDVISGDFNNVGLELRWLKHIRLFDQEAKWLVGSKLYRARNTTAQGPGSTLDDADFNIYAENFSDYPNQSDFLLPNRSIALFSELLWKPNDRLKIIPGIRIESIKTEAKGNYLNVIFDNAGNAIARNVEESDRLFDRIFVISGVGLHYRINPNMTLIANISQNYRSVTFSDIRTVSPSFIIDPDLTDEKGFTADVSIKSSVNDRLRYDLGLYSLLYDNRIGIILDDRANRVRTNVGKALILGLESLIEYNVIKLSDREEEDMTLKTFVNLAITNSQYISSQENNVKGNKVEFIPFINLKMGIQMGYKNFLSNLQFSFLSEQYTDAENSQTPEGQDSRSGIIGTVPAYHVMDWSNSLALGHFKLEFGVTNLLDKAYFTRRALGYPGPGIISADGRNIYLAIQYNFGSK